MSYQVLQRVTGRRETRRVDLPIVGWSGNCWACGSAGSTKMILGTEDHGETWGTISNPSKGVRALTRTGDGCYVALMPTMSYSPPFYSSLIYTLDNGETWTQGPSFSDESLWTAASDGSGVILAAGDSPVYRSEDYGVTWDAGTPSIGDAVFYAGEGLFFSAADGMLYKSTDKGNTWDSGTPMLEWYDEWNAYEMYVRDVKANGNTVLAATYSGSAPGKMMRSTDGGESYTAIDTFGEIHSISAIAYLGNGVFVAGGDSNDGSGGRIFRSENDGLTWQDCGILKTDYMYILAVQSLGGGIVLAAAATYGYYEGLVFRSTDSGQTWDAGQDVGVINSFALI